MRDIRPGRKVTSKESRFWSRRDFVSKLAAVLREHNGLAPEWDEDQEAIAKHLNVSKPEFKKLLQKYGHSGTGHGSRL